jgi:hypothetical protein
VADAPAVVKGTFDVPLLETRTWTPMDGVEITRWVESRSGGAVGLRG